MPIGALARGQHVGVPRSKRTDESRWFAGSIAASCVVLGSLLVFIAPNDLSLGGQLVATGGFLAIGLIFYFRMRGWRL